MCDTFPSRCSCAAHVPPQRPRRRHRHVWAMIEQVMGFDVQHCTCGEKRFVRRAVRQMELF